MTGEQISTYQLMVVRAAIKLEKLGLKHSGGSVRARWAAQLGLKPRDAHDKFVNKLTELISNQTKGIG